MVTSLGHIVLSLVKYLGELALLAYDTGVSIVVAKLRVKLLLRQMFEVGWRSQLVVIVTGMFTGAVLTAQTYFQFSKLGMKSAVGSALRSRRKSER